MVYCDSSGRRTSSYAVIYRFGSIRGSIGQRCATPTAYLVHLTHLLTANTSFNKDDRTQSALISIPLIFISSSRISLSIFAMEASLDVQDWKDIESLIQKALGAREAYRTGTKDARAMAAAWRPIMRLLAKFPEGTFTKNNNQDIADIDPYGKEVLTTFTEGMWAFSLGPVLDDLDCPQTATDLYSYFGQDLYQVWYNSEPKDKNNWAALFQDVTNKVTDYNLITNDTTARAGLDNSPRAAMAAHAWVITNSMCGSGDVGHAIASEARQLWETRCGPFVVSHN
ncbi:hypothetical protein SNK04_011954 [Fusarium graminearum]